MAEKENKNPGDDSVRPKVMAKWKKPAVELTDEQKIDFISAWEDEPVLYDSDDNNDRDKQNKKKPSKKNRGKR